MSTIKVNKIENTGTTAGGVEIDSSGHVQVDGLQMPTTGPLSNRNLIINGAMEVAQRGTSSTTSGYNTIDRFAIQFTSGGTATQESLTSGSPYSEGFRKFARVANTTASTDVNAKRQISYLMEAQDLARSGWDYTSPSNYITLSFWVRASVTQTYYVNLTTIDGTAQHYTFAISLTADTWTKIEKTIPGNSNITINNDNGLGLQIDFVPFFGTNFTDSSFTLDSWAAFSSSSRYPNFSTSWAGTTNATFDVTGVQLEVGEKATPFEHRSFNDELARCQRYYCHYGSPFTTVTEGLRVGIGYVTAPTQAHVILPTGPGKMRTDPTANHTNSQINDAATNEAISSFGDVIAYNGHVYLQINTSSGLTEGRGCNIRFNTTSGNLTLNSEF